MADRTLGGPGFDDAGGLALAPGSSLLLAGQIQIDSNVDVFVMRLAADGSGCDLGSPTQPSVWSDTLQVDAPSVVPTPTTFVPQDSAFDITEALGAAWICPPM